MTTSDDSKISQDRREALRYAFAIGSGAALAAQAVATIGAATSGSPSATSAAGLPAAARCGA